MSMSQQHRPAMPVAVGCSSASHDEKKKKSGCGSGSSSSTTSPDPGRSPTPTAGADSPRVTSRCARSRRLDGDQRIGDTTLLSATTTGSAMSETGGRSRKRKRSGASRSSSSRKKGGRGMLITASSALLFCAALVRVINLGGGGEGGGLVDPVGFLRGTSVRDDPAAVRRLLQSIEDGGESSDGSGSGGSGGGDASQRTLTSMEDERILQAFTPEEYRLLQAATQTAEYKKNPVGVMQMLLAHLKGLKGSGGSGGGTAGGTTATTRNEGDGKDGQKDEEGKVAAASDEGQEQPEPGKEEEDDDDDGRGKLSDIIDHLYREVTKYDLLRKNGITDPPPVPSYLDLYEHYGWTFDGLSQIDDVELSRQVRELRYPDKFTCTDIDPETGRPVKKVRQPGEADACYVRLMPLVEIMDDGPDEDDRRSVMDRFNVVHTAVRERMDGDRRDEMKRRAEEMREAERRRREREERERMEKEEREREEARKAQGW